MHVLEVDWTGQFATLSSAHDYEDGICPANHVAPKNEFHDPFSREVWKQAQRRRRIQHRSRCIFLPDQRAKQATDAPAPLQNRFDVLHLAQLRIGSTVPRRPQPRPGFRQRAPQGQVAEPGQKRIHAIPRKYLCGALGRYRYSSTIVGSNPDEGVASCAPFSSVFMHDVHRPAQPQRVAEHGKPVPQVNGDPTSGLCRNTTLEHGRP
mmetsp:Transcript_24982/g.80497  ORF Transcript_24982/g.80497 Transcript_24982/m.80497 type:complete len:207 (+) Transcript_24982:442-1062(+)